MQRNERIVGNLVACSWKTRKEHFKNQGREILKSLSYIGQVIKRHSLKKPTCLDH